MLLRNNTFGCEYFLLCLRGCQRLTGMDAPGAGRNGLARRTGGWTLLVIGIAGCVLPVLPGIPLALAGLLLLSRDYAWASKALHHVKRRVRGRERTEKDMAES